MMQRILLASLAALLVGSAGAFFLFVSVLSIAAVALMLAGLVVMFGLGFQAGARGMTPSEPVRIHLDRRAALDRAAPNRRVALNRRAAEIEP
jgi:hypothetical protein